jgi:DNA-binding response OmpR family regulator
MHRLKVLLIEDDLDFAAATTKILEKAGYEVVSATTGKEGRKKALQENPELIILDIMLPDQEGFSICRELKDDYRTSGIPVLVLTSVSAKARGEGYAEKIAAHHKADDYLEKPVKSEELLERVNRLITSAGMALKKEKTTVLVADDDPDFVAATKKILQANGYRVLVAENGEECITMAKTHLPDMIILDIILPDKDGYTVCYELKDSDRTRSIPILMLTAIGEQFKRPEFAQEIAIDHQADDYADKPIKPEDLLKKVRKHTLTAGYY